MRFQTDHRIWHMPSSLRKLVVESLQFESESLGHWDGRFDIEIIDLRVVESSNVLLDCEDTSLYIL